MSRGVCALVPFKRFTHAKGRLRSTYSDRAVEELSRAMLQDVLGALRSAPSVEEAWVLTDDLEVASVGEGAGAIVVIEDPDPGLNPVIDAATFRAAHAGFEASLVVLGDVPLLEPGDVEAVIQVGVEAPVVIVPSQDGGTTLLYRRPPERIAARFGGNSAAAHEAAARAQGIEPRVLRDFHPRVRLDLDTPEDAERLLETPSNSRTREVLEKHRP